MTFITLIPMADNDGIRFPHTVIDEIMEDLISAFGGVTVLGRVRGAWVDSEDGRVYRDVSTRVMVVCDDNDLEKARKAVVEIGRKLRQIEMYFEVRLGGDVEMIRVD